MVLRPPHAFILVILVNRFILIDTLNKTIFTTTGQKCEEYFFSYCDNREISTGELWNDPKLEGQYEGQTLDLFNAMQYQWIYK